MEVNIYFVNVGLSIYCIERDLLLWDSGNSDDVCKACKLPTVLIHNTADGIPSIANTGEHYVTGGSII